MAANPSPPWVLLVSRDDEVLVALRRQCQRERLSLAHARSAAEAVRAVRADGPDVLVLDLALPDEDAFDALRRIRQESDVPLILLSEEGADVEEVVGLTLGADDVVPRSVLPRLFVARVKALLRRSRPQRQRESPHVGQVELDVRQYRATVGGRDVGLTLSEFRILEALARVAGTALTRRRLLRAIASEGAATERTVDVHVSNIRRKLVPFGLPGLVETVRGVGYRAAAGGRRSGRWPDLADGGRQDGV